MRRALVSSNHQVRIIAVIHHHLRWMHHLTTDTIIRYIEERHHEIAISHIGQGGPLGAILKRGFHPKPAFGPGRYNQGVLGHLGLHQAENFIAQIEPIRPADAAPGYLSAAQMNPFHSGAMNINFKAGSWMLQVQNSQGIEFYGQRMLLGIGTEKIGSNRGIDKIK